MRSLSIAFALAIIGAAIAAPTSDATVPELSLIQSDEAVKNAEAAADAKDFVQSMLDTGSDASACQDLADAILTEVQENIKHQEELLAYMPDGSACKSEGQDVADAAQAAVDSAQTTKTSADAAAAVAASAPVDFGSYPLSSISLPSTCTQFVNDPAFNAAMTTSQQAQNAATTAAAELTAAQNELESAQEAQASAIKKCECDAYTAYDAAYKVANTRSDEDLAAWKKGKHMQCVIAGTDPSACDVGSPPEVQRCALAEGVDASSCPGEVLLQQDDTCKIGKIRPTCVNNKCRVRMYGDGRRRTVTKTIVVNSYGDTSEYHDGLGDIKVKTLSAKGEGCLKVKIYDDDGKFKKVHNEMWHPKTANGPVTKDLKFDLKNDVKALKIWVKNNNPANCVEP